MKTVEKTLIRFVNDKAGPDCLNLGLGEPGFPTPAPILAHVRDHIAEWTLGYTPNEGYRELRELIAARESAEAGVAIAPERVIVTVGSEEAMCVFLQASVEIDHQAHARDGRALSAPSREPFPVEGRRRPGRSHRQDAGGHPQQPQ
jgi:aspartate/methionine/tyrosine aminotransferase